MSPWPSEEKESVRNEELKAKIAELEASNTMFYNKLVYIIDCAILTPEDLRDEVLKEHDRFKSLKEEE